MSKSNPSKESIPVFFWEVLKNLEKTPEQKALSMYESAFRSGHREMFWIATTLLEMKCDATPNEDLQIDMVLETLMNLEGELL